MTDASDAAGSGSTPRPPAAPTGFNVLIAAVAFAILLALISGSVILLQPPGAGLLATPTQRLYLTVALFAGQSLALIVAVALALSRRTDGRAAAGLVPLGWRRFALAGLFGLVLAIGLSAALYLLQQAFGLPSRTPGAGMIAPAGFSWIGWAITLPVVGVLAPIGEELMFRGLLFGWLRRYMPPVAAALLAAIPFGLLHFDASQSVFQLAAWQHVIYAALAGFFLALIYQRNGSLWASISAHMVINIIAVSEVYIALATGVPLNQV